MSHIIFCSKQAGPHQPDGKFVTMKVCKLLSRWHRENIAQVASNLTTFQRSRSHSQRCACGRPSRKMDHLTWYIYSQHFHCLLRKCRWCWRQRAIVWLTHCLWNVSMMWGNGNVRSKWKAFGCSHNRRQRTTVQQRKMALTHYRRSNRRSNGF